MSPCLQDLLQQSSARHSHLCPRQILGVRMGLAGLAALRRMVVLQTGELYLGEVEDMCDAVLHGKSPLVNLDDSRKNTAVIVALLESAKSGIAC